MGLPRILAKFWGDTIRLLFPNRRWKTDLQHQQHFSFCVEICEESWLLFNKQLQLFILVFNSWKHRITDLNSYSFSSLGLWVLGLSVPHINESQLQTYESRTLFLMTSLQYYCILGLAEIKTLHPRDKIMRNRCRMRNLAQVTKSAQLLTIKLSIFSWYV